MSPTLIGGFFTSSAAWEAWYISCHLPGGSAGKNCCVGDLSLIPGLGISPGEGNGYPLQYSGLQNSMDCIVHGVTKESDTTEGLNNNKRDLFPLSLGSQFALVVKNLPANTGDTGDTGSIPGLGRSLGEGNGNPLQYSCLENSMD